MRVGGVEGGDTPAAQPDTPHHTRLQPGPSLRLVSLWLVCRCRAAQSVGPLLCTCPHPPPPPHLLRQLNGLNGALQHLHNAVQLHGEGEKSKVSAPRLLLSGKRARRGALGVGVGGVGVAGAGGRKAETWGPGVTMAHCMPNPDPHTLVPRPSK